jgi:hypothetical protein
MKPQFFKYTLSDEFPISDLQTKFSDHRRLSVFAQKGCVCVSCGRVGTKLFKGVDNGGGVHVDLYTDDLVPLTVDHIIPRSLGGEDHMDNYQPMCFPCNNKKGNGKKNNNNCKRELKVDMSAFIKATLIDQSSLIGQSIFKIRKYAHIAKHLGEVDSIGVNPHNGNSAAIIHKGSKVSYYDLTKSLYIQK